MLFIHSIGGKVPGLSNTLISLSNGLEYLWKLVILSMYTCTCERKGCWCIHLWRMISCNFRTQFSPAVSGSFISFRVGYDLPALEAEVFRPAHEKFYLTKRTSCCMRPCNLSCSSLKQHITLSNFQVNISYLYILQSILKN